GPIAGLAAGLGLAALASHFGFGEGLANAMTLLLLGLLAVVAIRFVLARLRPAPLGYAGPAPVEPRLASSSGGAAAAPASIDAADFARAAKLLFIRLQAANDAGDLDDLRRFTTPEMFAAARLDLQERRDAAQRTDVVQLDAELVDTAREGERDIASVRFHGLIREEAGGVAQPFDEVWHLVRPADASRDWAIAGIEQAANA
ncbi:MAG TPA: Tim44-like domain-containing protein, partial [Ideonella sp.]|nr:Tim44-like domain-containing protein [Ideonella sp.]